MGATTTSTGFVGWILNYGQIVLFFAQLLFWAALGVAVVWAAMIFNRLATFMMSGGETAESVRKTVSVEEFVE